MLFKFALLISGALSGVFFDRLLKKIFDGEKGAGTFFVKIQSDQS